MLRAQVRKLEKLEATLPDDEVLVHEDEVDIHLNPKIGPDWMVPGQRYGQSWTAMDGFVNLRNERDRVLSVYALRKPFARHPLGRVGLTSLAQRGVDLSLENAFEIDVSARVGEGHLVRDYTTHADLAHEIRPFVLHDPALVLHRR